MDEGEDPSTLNENKGSSNLSVIYARIFRILIRCAIPGSVLTNRTCLHTHSRSKIAHPAGFIFSGRAQAEISGLRVSEAALFKAAITANLAPQAITN